MTRKPKGGLVGRAVYYTTSLAAMDIPRHAAATCYFITLGVFPGLLLILSVLRFTPLEVETLLAVLGGVVPDALMVYVSRLVYSTYQNSSSAMVSLSALTALWAASRGVNGLLQGLNHIYAVSENRNFLYTRFLSLVYTFLLVLLLLLTLVLHVFGSTLMDALYHSQIPFVRFFLGIIDLRFFLLLALQTIVFTGMFMLFPNQRNGLGESLPGALLTSLGWLTLSDLFSTYVEYFPNYANIYGSVYAVALGMLWLYACICLIYLGGALNRFLIQGEQG